MIVTQEQLKRVIDGLSDAINDLYQDFMAHQHLADGTVCYPLAPAVEDYMHPYKQWLLERDEKDESTGYDEVY